MGFDKKGYYLSRILFVLFGAALCMVPVGNFRKETPTITASFSETPAWDDTCKYIILSKGQYTQLLKQADKASEYQKAYEEVRNTQTFHVEASAYNATKKQCGNSKGITASGTKVHQGRTIAVSRRLKHLLGKRVELIDGDNHLGFFIVEDLMAKDIKGSKVDVYLDRLTEAEDFGKRKLKMVVLGEV